MKFIRIFLATMLLSACASTPDLISKINPFKIDIRQGNYVTQEMVAQLKPGQTRDQVRFILGTPLVVDIFHNDRWDYIYRFQPGRGDVEQRRLTVFFENNVLARLDGDVVANTGEANATPSSMQTIDIFGPDEK
jgi:outer membrane protein assembly factor BamE